MAAPVVMHCAKVKRLAYVVRDEMSSTGYRCTTYGKEVRVVA